MRLRLSTSRSIDERGYIHFILPVITIVGVAIIGVVVLGFSHAATTYSGPCTNTSYTTKNENTYYPCVQDSQELMNAIQHKESSKTGYRTATSHTSGTFTYGSEDYLVMDGGFGPATSTAVHRLDSSTTLTPKVWQYLCSAVVSNGLSSGTLGNTALNFKNGQPVIYPATVFTDACKTASGSGSGSGGTGGGAAKPPTTPVAINFPSYTSATAYNSTMCGQIYQDAQSANEYGETSLYSSYKSKYPNCFNTNAQPNSTVCVSERKLAAGETATGLANLKKSYPYCF